MQFEFESCLFFKARIKHTLSVIVNQYEKNLVNQMNVSEPFGKYPVHGCHSETGKCGAT